MNRYIYPTYQRPPTQFPFPGSKWRLKKTAIDIRHLHLPEIITLTTSRIDLEHRMMWSIMELNDWTIEESIIMGFFEKIA